jgi:S1-C subfamily serine protease
VSPSLTDAVSPPPIGKDPDTDLAVLKSRAQAAVFAVERYLRITSRRDRNGDRKPFNLSSTVTQGILSAKGRRDLGISAYEDFLRTDAAINPATRAGSVMWTESDWN